MKLFCMEVWTRFMSESDATRSESDIEFAYYAEVLRRELVRTWSEDGLCALFEQSSYIVRALLCVVRASSSKFVRCSSLPGMQPQWWFAGCCSVVWCSVWRMLWKCAWSWLLLPPRFKTSYTDSQETDAWLLPTTGTILILVNSQIRNSQEICSPVQG